MRLNLACFSPTHGPCQVVNLKASNFACMAAMLHQKKMGILPQNTDCRPHAPTPMRGHFGAEHPNVAANHHTMACTL